MIIHIDSHDVGLYINGSTAGQLIALLDAALVNGYNTRTLTSITRVGAVATATFTAHGYRNNQAITISGATGGDAALYNGTFYAFNVTANTFDYTMGGTPGGSATGTLVSKGASLGWTKEYSGTNLAAYRSATGTRFYMAVNDTGSVNGQLAVVRGYETMSAVSTGTNPFPTAGVVPDGSCLWHKGSFSSSTAKHWWIVGDGKHFKFSHEGGNTEFAVPGVYFFGDFTPFAGGDTYNCAISLQYGLTLQSPYNDYTQMTTPYRLYAARSYVGGVGAVSIGLIANGSFRGSTALTNAAGGQSTAGANTLVTYHRADGRLLIQPIYMIESSVIRGVLPGVWDVVANSDFMPNSVFMTPGSGILVGTGDMAGKSFLKAHGSDASGTSQRPCVLVEVSNTY